jgi:hypothetical protein
VPTRGVTFSEEKLLRTMASYLLREATLENLTSNLKHQTLP